MSDNLIGIIIGAIIATGGGIVAYFKYLDSKQVQHENHKEDVHLQLLQSQQLAKDKVWQEMKDLAEIQSKRIVDLVTRNSELVSVTNRIKELEDELYNCKKERRKLIDELADMVEETREEVNGTIT